MKTAPSLVVIACLSLVWGGCSAGGVQSPPAQISIPASEQPASRVVDLGGGARVVFDDEPVNGSTLRVSTAGAPANPSGWVSMATPVHLEVENGSVGSGATIEFAIPAGVPTDPDAVGITTYDEASAQWVAVPVEIDQSRRMIRARTTHFSWWNPGTWDWPSIGASINQGVGQVLGKRAGPAQCDSARPAPAWVSTIIGVTNDDAMVIRACSQSEGDVLDIQIVNNRPYGQVLTYGAAVKWGWHEPGSSPSDMAASAIMDKLLNGKGLYLPPKGRASVGIFRMASGAAASFPINMSKASLLIDVLRAVATDVLPEAAGGNITAALLSECGAHLLDVTPPEKFDSAEAVRTQIVDLSGCTEAAFKSLVAKGALDKHKVDELAATLSALKKADTIGWILKAYDTEWNLLDLFVDVKLVPGVGDFGHGFRVIARRDETQEPAPVQPSSAPPVTLGVSLSENPFRCDGALRPLGTISGAQPGELVAFDSPQAAGLKSGTATSSGSVAMKWICGSSDVGTKWTITATGQTSKRSVTFTLGSVGAADQPVQPAQPPAPGPSVSVSKGTSAQGQAGCSSTYCAYLVITFSNFAAGSHTVTCNAAMTGGDPFYTYATAQSSTAVCYFGYPGRQVWATVDGVRSNTVDW